VVRVDADLADAVHAHVAQQQVRPRVERTARLEHRELEREARRERDRIDLRIAPALDTIAALEPTLALLDA